MNASNQPRTANGRFRSTGGGSLPKVPVAPSRAVGEADLERVGGNLASGKYDAALARTASNCGVRVDSERWSRDPDYRDAFRAYYASRLSEPLRDGSDAGYALV